MTIGARLVFRTTSSRLAGWLSLIATNTSCAAAESFREKVLTFVRTREVPRITADSLGHRSGSNEMRHPCPLLQPTLRSNPWPVRWTAAPGYQQMSASHSYSSPPWSRDSRIAACDVNLRTPRECSSWTNRRRTSYALRQSRDFYAPRSEDGAHRVRAHCQSCRSAVREQPVDLLARELDQGA